MSRWCRLVWNAATRRRRRRWGRNATFCWTIRTAISPTLITHNDSPPLSVTTMSRDGKSVPHMWPFLLGVVISRAWPNPPIRR
jgi:hypothetical protein